MADDKVIIYSDGGSDPNPGIGGWAALLRFGEHEKVITGNAPEATNNRMELQAAIGALQALKWPCQVAFHTDSEYVRRGITEWVENWIAQNWMHKDNKPVANADLWRQLWTLVKKHDIEWHWVRGHAGDPLNERVDQLARQARLEITPIEMIPDDVPRIYLRASCRGNPGPGGWGVVIEVDGETEQYSGSALATTNNRMELTAAMEGLLLFPVGSGVQLFTTSDYLFQGATQWIKKWRQNNWQKKGGKFVANNDLWQALDQLMNNYAIHWVNAKGQALPALAEASKLATEAIDVA